MAELHERLRRRIESHYRDHEDSRRLRDQAVEMLERIRPVLAEERAETRQMLATYRRYVRGEASEAEMEVANEQFRELLKLTGLGALATLPFAPVTLPAMVKVGHHFGIEIIPRAFRELRGAGGGKDPDSGPPA